MGNQGKVQRNSKVCKEVQNNEKYSRYAILGCLFSKTEDMHSKVRKNKFSGQNGYCTNYFIKKSLPYISCNSKGTKLQRMYGDKKSNI